jgi:hypothetical protein
VVTRRSAAAASWGAGAADEGTMAERESDRFERAMEAAMGDTSRPWLGVRFACAGAYVRVLRNAEGTGYTARCPRCGRCMRFRVGQGGTSQRFFEVRC